MKNTFPILLLVSALLLSTSASAQNFYKERISRDHLISLGIGPSFAYMDNGGQYRSWNFEIKPSVSVAMTKRMNKLLDLRATTGIQWIQSGGSPGQVLQDAWTANNASFTATGSAIYLDIMPSINLIPFSNHMHRSRFNLYGGLGLGIMQVNTEQTKSFSSEENPSKNNLTTGYVPIRAGLSYRIGPYLDIAGEGTMLLTFTDNLDGNIGFNRFGDHMAQAQLVIRKYLSPKIKE